MDSVCFLLHVQCKKNPQDKQPQMIFPPELKPPRFYATVKALPNDGLVKMYMLFSCEHQRLGYVRSPLGNCKLAEDRSKPFISAPPIIQCVLLITSTCADSFPPSFPPSSLSPPSSPPSGPFLRLKFPCSYRGRLI